MNPYVEVYLFRDNLCGLFTENCDGMGDVWMYLIIGPEKAMLIDTAYGLGDLKGLVDKLTGGKPIIVVNTHEHYDHAYGNCRFEKVNCHEYLVPYLKNQNEHMWDYLFDAFGNNIWLEFDRQDLPKFKKYEIAGVPDGYKFNLGGDYDIELFWTAGHAAGHAMFIDKKGRNLFAGDDVISDRISCGAGPRKGGFYQEYCNLTSYRDRLKILCTRLDEFDYVFSGHFTNNLENSVLLNILEALNEVIADPKNYTYIEETISNTGAKSVAFYKQVKGLGRIRYSENGVYPSKA
jgi:glyoxylase-like metal-dependent hydrolase (beta-lactamase superfamily II)